LCLRHIPDLYFSFTFVWQPIIWLTILNFNKSVMLIISLIPFSNTPVPVYHCIVSSPSIYHFWLPLCYLQNCMIHYINCMIHYINCMVHYINCMMHYINCMIHYINCMIHYINCMIHYINLFVQKLN
jgi:hypothetical protein